MGGVIAFEMAQILVRSGREVAFLALLDTNYPVQPAGFRQHRDLFKRRIYPAVEKWEERFEEIRAKGMGRFVRERITGWNPFKRKVIRASAIGDDIPDRRAGLPPHLQKLWRANMRAMNAYRPQPYAGRVTLFWGAESPGIASDRRLGWSEVAEDGLEVHVVPGTHQTMRMEPHVRVLAAEINTCIERASRTTGLSIQPTSASTAAEAAEESSLRAA
jgi:thioesterase domain-containing protein